MEESKEHRRDQKHPSVTRKEAPAEKKDNQNAGGDTKDNFFSQIGNPFKKTTTEETKPKDYLKLENLNPHQKKAQHHSPEQKPSPGLRPVQSTILLGQPPKNTGRESNQGPHSIISASDLGSEKDLPTLPPIGIESQDSPSKELSGRLAEIKRSKISKKEQSKKIVHHDPRRIYCKETNHSKKGFALPIVPAHSRNTPSFFCFRPNSCPFLLGSINNNSNSVSTRSISGSMLSDYDFLKSALHDIREKYKDELVKVEGLP